MTPFGVGFVVSPKLKSAAALFGYLILSCGILLCDSNRSQSADLSFAPQRLSPLCGIFNCPPGKSANPGGEYYPFAKTTGVASTVLNFVPEVRQGLPVAKKSIHTANTPILRQVVTSIEPRSSAYKGYPVAEFWGWDIVATCAVGCPASEAARVQVAFGNWVQWQGWAGDYELDFTFLDDRLPLQHVYLTANDVGRTECGQNEAKKVSFLIDNSTFLAMDKLVISAIGRDVQLCKCPVQQCKNPRFGF